jgi:drug/metabolite transporter (DMT)-like permease
VIIRPELPREPRTLGFIAAIGAGDLAANACFAAATNEGLLSVVSVLASLYPVVTVLLARAVLGERVRREQGLGIAAALAGVALIASGA